MAIMETCCCTCTGEQSQVSIHYIRLILKALVAHCVLGKGLLWRQEGGNSSRAVKEEAWTLGREGKGNWADSRSYRRREICRHSPDMGECGDRQLAPD